MKGLYEWCTIMDDTSSAICMVLMPAVQHYKIPHYYSCTSVLVVWRHSGWDSRTCLHYSCKCYGHIHAELRPGLAVGVSSWPGSQSSNSLSSCSGSRIIYYYHVLNHG